MVKQEQSDWRKSWVGIRRTRDNKPVQAGLTPGEFYKLDNPGHITTNIFWEGNREFLLGELQSCDYPFFCTQVIIRGVVCFGIMKETYRPTPLENLFFMDNPRPVTKRIKVTLKEGEFMRVLEKYILATGETRYRMIQIYFDPDDSGLRFKLLADRFVAPHEEGVLLMASFVASDKRHIDYRNC